MTVTYHRTHDQLSRIELPNEGSITYNSYRWSQPTQITYPGGSNRQTEYDNLLRSTRILTRDPGENPLLDYQYDYDATGNILQKATQGKTYDYDYDLLQRLTEAVATSQPATGDPQIETEGWAYDPNGNRTLDNLNPGSWVYDTNDRLQSAPQTNYGYDQAGHTVSKTEGGVTTHYRYNAEGRLARIEDADQNLIAEYQYDPMGRRVRKATLSGVIYFHYADEGLVGEFDGAGSPVRLYGYQPDATWTTDPVYQKTSEGYAYYQNDHLGMPQQLVQKSGAKVWAGEYRAFGELVSETGAWENRLRFAGQYFDQESNHYYNYFRDYDPVTGRYVQEDPYGLAGSVNLYSYADNNPIIYYDPTGEIIPVVVYGAFWLECFDDCISRKSVVGLVCDVFGQDKFSICATKCTIEAMKPWKKITKVFRFAFRISHKSGVPNKASRKAKRKQQRESRRRNRR